ncbi:MAG: hypothetical protein BWX88_04478 [Planctomycetes bacterium ADurb.Bin126]|nr:MAG: hypothetical protein BWX88_04478 [Planctomycetes bacterium ADurb.Bin126]HOD82524.1 DUF1080 domain-containing protein [Phycisphaerae bacterium]
MKAWSIMAMTCSVLAVAAAVVAGPFYGDPPDENHPWAVHDDNRPQPPVVTPGTCSTQEQAGKPPSDAVVLFDGKDLSKWESDKGEKTKWIVKDGAMECVPGSGYIRTKEQFGDCQLHVEWAAPKDVKGDSQGRGNSGIFPMGVVEVQVLDNYNNPTYADGFAASVYGINPPMANALRPPGQFNTYEIIFRRPIFKGDKCIDPGYLTVYVNGVLVQDHTSLEDGGGGHKNRSKPRPFPEAGPLKLQDHGNPVRFRNIWYRPLPPRVSQGGTDGHLTAEAATAKKKEIAAAIREDSVKRRDPGNPLAEMLRLMESLQYENQPAAAAKVKQMADQYVESVQKVPANRLESKKGEIMQVFSAFQFMTKFKFLPADFAPQAELQKIIKAQGWDKKKR